MTAPDMTPPDTTPPETTLPELPRTTPGEVLLVSTCYEDGEAVWGGLPDDISGRAGDVLALGDNGIRLRLTADPAWDLLRGGSVPALVPGGEPAPPVVLLADPAAVYGGEGPLLIDVAATPGRGVRVSPEQLAEILGRLSDGTLAFDDLVRDMDVYGLYQGDAGVPASPAPTGMPRTTFPAFPASTDDVLLVRTSFQDEDGWLALLAELGGADADGRIGADVDWNDIDPDNFPFTALVVDDKAYAGLLPGQVPALVPPGQDVPLVALADARTCADAHRPLIAVDLDAVPGQPAVLPPATVASLAANLRIGNMDFAEFVPVEGVDW